MLLIGKKILKSPRYQNISRLVHSSSILKDTKVSTANPSEDILQDLQKPELSDEDILQKRFKSRIPEVTYRKLFCKEAVPIFAQYDYSMYRLRKRYGMYGKDSKLNPGICWPTKQQLLEIIHYDKVFEPPLQERINAVESRKAEEEANKRAVEAEVDKNMSKLDKWISEYHQRNEKKASKARELRKEREQLVDDICDYLGYDIDPKDPRFNEAVEQRNKEKKKAIKAKKQQESYDKMLEKLKQLAQSK